MFVAMCKTEKGLTMPQLMRAAGCSMRTTYRYLDVLEDAGVRMTVIGGAGKKGQAMLRRIDDLGGIRVRRGKR